MNGKYLLDTNIIIALFNKEKSVLEKLKKTDEIFISVTTVGELYYGAFKSRYSKRNLNSLEAFLKKNKILENDSNTAKKYGLIKNQLKMIGKPIPENDIWIAGICKQYNLILVTRDEHFDHIKDLKIEKW